MRARASVPLHIAEALLSLALLVVFFSVRDLPLIDLPQHALQISSWLHLDAHDVVASDLELNFQTPYFLCYPIARLLASIMPVLAALKLIFWASITSQALALRALCSRLGHDPWLGLLGFPLGMGYAFCFGFITFCAALPLVYLAILAALDQRAAPSWRNGLKLGCLLALLLVGHGVALGFSMAVLGPLLLWGEGKAWQRLLPLLTPVVLGVLWLAPGGTKTRIGGDAWQVEASRLLELPAQLVGYGSVDQLATVLGSLLLLTLAWSMGVFRGLRLALPLVVVLLGYACFPTLFRGVGMLQARFSAYVVPAILLAFRARANLPSVRRTAIRSASVLLACAVISVFAYRLRDFNQETANFHALVARLPSGLSIRPLLFERTSRAFPGAPAMLHVPAYYSVEKGGSPGYSFAMYSTSVVRFRAGVPIKMGGGAEWAPERFDAEREADGYEYFVVKSSVDRSAIFGGPSPAAVLDQHVGDWWGYRRLSRARAARF